MTKILLSHKKTSISHAILFFRCHEKTSVFVQSFFFGRLFFQKGLFGCSIIIEVPTSKKDLCRTFGKARLLIFYLGFLISNSQRQNLFFFHRQHETVNFSASGKFWKLSFFSFLCLQKSSFAKVRKNFFVRKALTIFLELTQVSEGSYFDPWSGLPGRRGGG